MSPLGLLALTFGITALAALAHRRSRHRRQNELRALAGQWQMNYSPRDQLRLTLKIAGRFPVPGAANLKVLDLIYGADQEKHRYVFTAEYTVGVVHRKRRLVRAAAFVEPRDSAQPHETTEVRLAPADLPLVEQYRRLAPVAMIATE
jgi:hypothetical protein